MFGPPQRFTAASTCSWLGHPVSGLQHYTQSALLGLAFASAPRLYRLTSHNIATRRPVLQKVRHHAFNSAVSARKHRVSGSLSLRSRGAFHLSLTVLYSIGHMVVFSLRRWSSVLPSGFLVSRRTPDSRVARSKFRLRGFYPLPPSFPELFGYLVLRFAASPYPPHISMPRLGSSDFARHYFRNRFYFLFLRVFRCFSSPGSLRITIYSLYDTSTLLEVSSLIRISAGRSLCAALRSFSQLVTSFFGAMYQGILPTLFVAYSSLTLA